MAVLRVVVVTRAIQIGRHNTAVVAPVLAVVALAELDTCNLGDGIGLVGRLQRAGEQGILRHGLRCEREVDAAAAQKQQLSHTLDLFTSGSLRGVKLQ